MTDKEAKKRLARMEREAARLRKQIKELHHAIYATDPQQPYTRYPDSTLEVLPNGAMVCGGPN